MNTRVTSLKSEYSSDESEKRRVASHGAVMDSDSVRKRDVQRDRFLANFISRRDSIVTTTAPGPRACIASARVGAPGPRLRVRQETRHWCGVGERTDQTLQAMIRCNVACKEN